LQQAHICGSLVAVPGVSLLPFPSQGPCLSKRCASLTCSDTCRLPAVCRACSMALEAFGHGRRREALVAERVGLAAARGRRLLLVRGAEGAGGVEGAEGRSDDARWRGVLPGGARPTRPPPRARCRAPGPRRPSATTRSRCRCRCCRPPSRRRRPPRGRRLRRPPRPAPGRPPAGAAAAAAAPRAQASACRAAAAARGRPVAARPSSCSA
jgi:hypothetical protein